MPRLIICDYADTEGGFMLGSGNDPELLSSYTLLLFLSRQSVKPEAVSTLQQDASQ